MNTEKDSTHANSNSVQPITRRGLIPLLTGGLLFSLLGFGNTSEPEQEVKADEGDDDFQTLLKPDGTIVKVRKRAVENSKVIKKDLSNSGFLSWLGKKSDQT